MSVEKSEPLSVSAALNTAKNLLSSLVLCVEGEVSEVSNKPGYKAVYFSIKDESATMPCMMWMNKYALSGVDLQVGKRVRLTGRFSVYAAKGRMSFDAASLEIAGEGDLRRKVEQIKNKLVKEGLIDASRKQPLPYLPQTIGVVTSPRGAAVHDVLRTLRRRYPAAEVKFAGVPVEGNFAAQGIIEGLRALYRAHVDVILVVRGGGSFEDLMPFNDEALARAIAQCPIPVVTGIGHEPDTTIADLVADYRASTPTAAAEAVSPGDGELLLSLDQSAEKLHRQMRNVLSSAQLRLQAKADRPLFTDASYLLSPCAMGVDGAMERLGRAIPYNVNRDRQTLDHAKEKLLGHGVRLTEQRLLQVQRSSEALSRNASKQVQFTANVLAGKAALLDSLSPLSILSRGYSVAYGPQGNILSESSQVSAGQHISVRLGKGTLDCAVEQVHE